MLFWMRSETYMSKINLRRGKLTVENRKSREKKRICSEVLVNSQGNPWSQSRRRNGRLWWEGFAEKESFKPGVKEWRGDGWWEWWVDGTNGGSATHTIGWGRIGEISACLISVDNIKVSYTHVPAQSSTEQHRWLLLASSLLSSESSSSARMPNDTTRTSFE